MSTHVVAYGGGVNTIAALVQLRRSGVVPRAIVMADPGDEWPQTYTYRDQIANPWLASIGFPSVTVVSRKSEAPFRPRAYLTKQETLREECLRTKALPSIAYGWKKCSQKQKITPQQWWMERQPWARDIWARGERILRVIGYDIDEMRRVKPESMDALEASRYQPCYPLIDAGLDRDACESLILSEGLSLPHKSACTYCTSNTLAEWRELRDTQPQAFAQAVEMSRNAALTSPDVVGLMRCNPHGKRQLHLWVDDRGPDRMSDEMPCECAL